MRASQTEIAVLGALSIEPMTGYRLREEIRTVLGHFWSESFGQIYPALRVLEQEGLVERLGGKRAGASNYALTATGRTRLRELLAQPIESQPPRNGLLLRLFFGRQLGSGACRELLLDTRQLVEQRLGALRAIRAEMASEPHYAADQPYWLMTVSFGEHSARATLAWIEESLAALEHLTADTREEAGG